MAKKKGQKNDDISFELLDEDVEIVDYAKHKNQKETSTKEEKQEIKEAFKIEENQTQQKASKQKSDSKLENEIEEYKNLLQLSRAEFDNYRKRSYSLLQNAKTDGELNVILKFLPALDGFDKAKDVITDVNVLKGVEMIEKELKDALKSIGVEEMNPLGEVFDANLHNALSTSNDENLDNDIITQVYKEGYTYNGKVIRYAQVIINKKQ